MGFDPVVADAVSLIESGGGRSLYGDRDDPADGIDPRAVEGPDGGWFWSLGPFQENVAGGAGESHLRRGGKLADLFDPVSATDRFIDRYRWAEGTAFLGETPGQVAARAQRPADPDRYASRVDATIASLRNEPGEGGACPPGHYRNVFGVCVPGSGGFVPGAGSPGGDPRGDLPTRPGAGQPATPGPGFDPLGGVAAAIENARKGAAELAIAAGIIGVAGVLAWRGVRKVLG